MITSLRWVFHLLTIHATTQRTSFIIRWWATFMSRFIVISLTATFC